jgi:hypothetical protein
VPTTIKPEDIVRLRNGRTAIVRELLRAGFRLVEDCASGITAIIHVDELYLVKRATPKRWPEHVL